MKKPTQIVPSKKRHGRDSSRLVIVSNLTGRGSPTVLCTIEGSGDNRVLRLSGGEAHRNETDLECAHRERIEETGIRQNDLSTLLREGFVHRGKDYNVHVFYCAVGQQIPIEKLKPTDKKIKGLLWANLTELLTKKSFNRIPIQETHHEYLRDLQKNQPNYLEELKSCILVQKETKSAS